MLCVSARFVALLGLRRPEQREQLQWPVRPHLCGGGAIKAPDGGESEERGAGAGAPPVASMIAAALGLDAAAAASSPPGTAPPIVASSVLSSAERFVEAQMCHRFLLSLFRTSL
jgi:hypothetical protein